MLGFVGLGLVFLDTEPLSNEKSKFNFYLMPYWKRVVYGNLVAVVGSGFAAVFLVKSKENLYRMTAYQKSQFLAIFGIPIFLILSLLIGDFDEESTGHSIFDIFYPWTFVIMLIIAGVCAFSNTYLLLRVTEIFSELGSAVAMQL